MIELRERCVVCGNHLHLYEYHGDWCVTCYARCYDPGAEDADDVELLRGRGATPEDALQDYLDQRGELGIEPVYAPSSLVGFIVPEPPAGWVVSPDATDPARLFFDSLSDAERNPELGPLYYGPMDVQKAANDT